MGPERTVNEGKQMKAPHSTTERFDRSVMHEDEAVGARRIQLEFGLRLRAARRGAAPEAANGATGPSVAMRLTTCKKLKPNKTDFERVSVSRDKLKRPMHHLFGDRRAPLGPSSFPQIFA